VIPILWSEPKRCPFLVKLTKKQSLLRRSRYNPAFAIEKWNVNQLKKQSLPRGPSKWSIARTSFVKLDGIPVCRRGEWVSASGIVLSFWVPVPKTSSAAHPKEQTFSKNKLKKNKTKLGELVSACSTDSIRQTSICAYLGVCNLAVHNAILHVL